MTDWLLVVLGIGLVIFVHEAGHFVAARLCKVRVDVFSLGFGPRLFGWRRGPTQYQVAAIPLGGYVKMAGDDAWPDDPEPAADSLSSKSVGQRFFIYSGGVIANVLFGLVVFPILFSVGVRFHEPLLGPPEPGKAAWHAGLGENTRVLSVNGHPVYAFMHIPNEVALGPDDETVLEVIPPGASESRTVRLEPRYYEDSGMYSIGVRPAFDPEHRVEVAPDGPAAKAGVQSGDRLIAIAGGTDGLPMWDRFAEVLEAGQPLRARFEREGEEYAVEIEPIASEEPAYSRIGVSAPQNELFAVRETSLTRRVDLRPGDRVLEVAGRPIFRELDLVHALADAEGPTEAKVERAGEAVRVEVPALSRNERFELLDALALRVDGRSTRLSVSPGEPAAQAGLVDGDLVLAIDGQDVDDYEDVTRASRAAAAADRAMTFLVVREGAGDGESRTLEVEVRPQPWHPLTYGLGARPAIYVYRVDDPLEAVQVGMVSCWKFLQDTWLTLKGMVVRKVSPKNVGGPIAIGVYAHDWASGGWTRLFFFLCMLSINLAFINVLPIPLLDGGHLLFLVIEKLKGSPVSYRVMSYSQVVGLVLIVSLFVFVLYNDVTHHILD